jgi:chemotaxis protein histidine kinase CheA
MEDSDIDIDGMSEQDLLKMESELEEEESADPAAEDPQPETEESPDKEDVGLENSESDKSSDDSEPVQQEETQPKDEEPEKGDVHKDVSPPKKWIEKRIRERERADVEKQHHKAQQKHSELEKQLAAAKQTIELMKERGADVPETPLDILSAENIKAVREEHGDTVADMFLALRSTMSTPTPGTENATDQQQGREDADSVDIRVSNLFQNDHLAYWVKELPDYYDKYAVKADSELMVDPKFLEKPYP